MPKSRSVIIVQLRKELTMPEFSGTSSTDMMVWNIKSGGFSTYDSSLEVPERGEQIQAFIEAQHAKGTETVGLTDAHRWDETYGGDEGIADHLGFRAARFVRLNDQRLNRTGMSGVGVAMATDHPIAESWELDLGTRQGLGAVLDIGADGLQVGTVYLDDLDEDIRSRQVSALFSGLKPDLPTVIWGDFNTLRPSLAYASLNVRARDVAVRALAMVLPPKSELGQAVRGMNERRVFPLFKQHGFHDADVSRKRPTAPARLPLFGVDYAMHNDLVIIEEVNVLPVGSVSDHRALSIRVNVQG
jgi:endonuclease/exonuclease/phosphatase family metal-dependent hydrolase